MIDCLAYIALADEIRPESKSAIAAFKKNGIKVMMATVIMNE
jgi:cation transport ATPase